MKLAAAGVELMANARSADSGGIQEETPAPGIPRPTLYAGWREVSPGHWPAGDLPELWDGKAAGRIVSVLLGER